MPGSCANASPLRTQQGECSLLRLPKDRVDERTSMNKTNKVAIKKRRKKHGKKISLAYKG